MDEASYAILEAEIRQRYSIIHRIYQLIAERRFRDTPEGIDSIAYQLHNLYGVYEELFETVARSFENQIEIARYHTDLLFRMKMEIKGIRPALLSEFTYGLLDEMRRFRHFFRHAYGVELRKEPVDRIVQQ